MHWGLVDRRDAVTSEEPHLRLRRAPALRGDALALNARALALTESPPALQGTRTNTTWSLHGGASSRIAWLHREQGVARRRSSRRRIAGRVARCPSSLRRRFIFAEALLLKEGETDERHEA